MAKGKGKGGSSGGPRKNHGPKRKMFHCWDSTTRWHFAGDYGKSNGILNKYHNYESFVLACTARGKRNPSEEEFQEFLKLPKEKKKEYFAALSK